MKHKAVKEICAKYMQPYVLGKVETSLRSHLGLTCATSTAELASGMIEESGLGEAADNHMDKLSKIRKRSAGHFCMSCRLYVSVHELQKNASKAVSALVSHREKRATLKQLS